MTTQTPTRAADTAEVPRERRSSALAVRRWFLILAPVLGGLFAAVGAGADPAVGLDGNKLYELYAANPEPLQFKSLGFHWGYAFWIAPALLIAPYVRGKGSWLANITAFVGFCGMTTLPGLLFIDWYDSAIGQVYGVEGNVAVTEVMNEMWGIPVFTTPGLLGFVLALPLTALTLWRAGRAPWWGCVIATVFLAAVSFTLHRATEPAHDR